MKKLTKLAAAVAIVLLFCGAAQWVAHGTTETSSIAVNTGTDEGVIFTNDIRLLGWYNLPTNHVDKFRGIAFNRPDRYCFGNDAFTVNVLDQQSLEPSAFQIVTRNKPTITHSNAWWVINFKENK